MTAPVPAVRAVLTTTWQTLGTVAATSGLSVYAAKKALKRLAEQGGAERMVDPEGTVWWRAQRR